MFRVSVYNSYSHMVEREKLSKLSELALRKRREGLTKLVPPLGDVLRGSLIERYLTCGNPNCKCARGERHGPVWYLNYARKSLRRRLFVGAA